MNNLPAIDTTLLYSDDFCRLCGKRRDQPHRDTCPGRFVENARWLVGYHTCGCTNHTYSAYSLEEAVRCIAIDTRDKGAITIDFVAVIPSGWWTNTVHAAVNEEHVEAKARQKTQNKIVARLDLELAEGLITKKGYDKQLEALK